MAVATITATESRDAEQNPPPDRAEQPLANEERPADRHELSGEQRNRDDDCGKGRDDLDLRNDVAKLGLKQGQVRLCEADGRLPDSPQLLPHAWRGARRLSTR